MRVFVTGGTGLVGRRLVKQLVGRGDGVVVLTRRPEVAKELFGVICKAVPGDPMQPGEWMKAVDDCDAVVNLAGENIFARRWNAAFKQRLFDSRVLTTRNVVHALATQPKRPDGQPKVLVNASAIGYYGYHGDEQLTEESPPGIDFMANICVEWEKAARAVEPAGMRCALVRIGVVLDKEGGALQKLLTPFKLGAGGPVGSGTQYMSWIHHEDMTGILLFALDNAAVTGPINATAPNPVTNKQFGKALGAALGRPAFVWTPAFMLELTLGGVAEIVTQGQRVIPQNAMALGYAFKYPTIDVALGNLVSG
jgi:uncharacterized protein (TIGR01777 family)